MSLAPAEIQQWLQLARWEGTLRGSLCRCPAGAAQFQHGAESSVCRDGSAPLSSTAPLATVSPRTSLSLPPNPPNSSQQS